MNLNPRRDTALQWGAATASLCISVLTHSWLLISVFPYSGFMALHLLPSLDEDNVGSFAGLIASAFMIGRALSSYSWGQASDVYGRKFVLIVSLGASCIFSLLFGTATSFPLALLWRFSLGLVNGVVSTAKVSVSEIAQGDERLETKGMGLVMGMWGWGFIFTPALSGLLAEPLRQNPKSKVFLHFKGILSRYPFILPNLVSVAFCIIAMVAVHCYVPETLPETQLSSPFIIPAHAKDWFLKKVRRQSRQPFSSADVSQEAETESTYLLSKSKNSETQRRRPSQVDFERVDSYKYAQMTHSESCSMLSTASPRHEQRQSAAPKPTSDEDVPRKTASTFSTIWSRRNTRNHLIAYWLFSFVAVTVEEAFPLYCISKSGGLGLTEVTIGKILSVSGTLFAIGQYFVYSYIVNQFGLNNAIRIGISMSGPLIALVPLVLFFNRQAQNGEITSFALVYLSVVFAIYRIFSLVFFSSVTVATNRTVDPSLRGVLNGISSLGGSVAKGVGPIFSGALVAICFSSGVFNPVVGGFVIFLTIGVCGAVAALISICLLEEEEKDEEGMELA